MALIDCPECRREVSSSAPTCPECGYPVMTGTPPIPPAAVSEQPKESWWKTAFAIALPLVVGGALMILGESEREYTGILGGLIIACSSVPTWYRIKLDRLKAGRVGGVSDARLANRMAEIEHRHREQMAQLDQNHREQIADLEERIEFTERLLARKRDELGPA